MKFKIIMLLAAALLLTSCTQKPDSTTSLYAFEAAETARKSWVSSPKSPEDKNTTETEVLQQVDTSRIDTIFENFQN